MTDTRKYEPRFIYYIHDETKKGDPAVATFHANLMDHSNFPALRFTDDKGFLVALHHLSPGHTVMATDTDGYSLQERPPTY